MDSSKLVENSPIQNRLILEHGTSDSDKYAERERVIEARREPIDVSDGTAEMMSEQAEEVIDRYKEGKEVGPQSETEDAASTGDAEISDALESSLIGEEEAAATTDGYDDLEELEARYSDGSLDADTVAETTCATMLSILENTAIRKTVKVIATMDSSIKLIVLKWSMLSDAGSHDKDLYIKVAKKAVAMPYDHDNRRQRSGEDEVRLAVGKQAVKILTDEEWEKEVFNISGKALGRHYNQELASTSFRGVQVGMKMARYDLAARLQTLSSTRGRKRKAEEIADNGDVDYSEAYEAQQALAAVGSSGFRPINGSSSAAFQTSAKRQKQTLTFAPPPKGGEEQGRMVKNGFTGSRMPSPRAEPINPASTSFTNFPTNSGMLSPTSLGSSTKSTPKKHKAANKTGAATKGNGTSSPTPASTPDATASTATARVSKKWSLEEEVELMEFFDRPGFPTSTNQRMINFNDWLVKNGFLHTRSWNGIEQHHLNLFKDIGILEKLEKIREGSWEAKLTAYYAIPRGERRSIVDTYRKEQEAAQAKATTTEGADETVKEGEKVGAGDCAAGGEAMREYVAEKMATESDAVQSTGKKDAIKAGHLGEHAEMKDAQKEGVDEAGAEEGGAERAGATEA